jgi:hypothetical protein
MGSKKGEGCAGFIMGSLLGPIGLIIMIASKGDRVHCPACKELMRRGAAICPHCRTTFAMQNQMRARGSYPAIHHHHRLGRAICIDRACSKWSTACPQNLVGSGPRRFGRAGRSRLQVPR